MTMEMTDRKDPKVVSNERATQGIIEPGKDAADQEDYPEKYDNFYNTSG